MIMKGIFVDDQVNQATFAVNMSTDGPDGMEIVFHQRQLNEKAEDLVKWISERSTDLLVLDYRLDEISGASPLRAGSIAQIIRENVLDDNNLDIPIVAISADPIYNREVLRDLTAMDLFDAVYRKSVFTRSQSTERNELLDLARSYKTLLTFGDNRLEMALELGDAELHLIDHQAFQEFRENLTLPHQFIRRFKNYFIDRNGILLDEPNLWARMGGDLKLTSDGEREKLHNCLQEKGVTYTGILGSGWPHWWGHRLENFFKESLGLELLDETGQQRIMRLNHEFGLNIVPAKSRWSDSSEEYFLLACASCLQPTSLDHTVPAYDPFPHSFGQQDRICWTCVQKGEYSSNEKFKIDEAGMFISEKIESGEITPPRL